MRRRLGTALLLVASATLAACGKQSTLDPHSSDSHDIAVLWWWMLGVASVIFLGALAMLVIGWIRRDRPGLPLIGTNEKATTGLVLVFGIAIPAVILIALFAVSNLWLTQRTAPPSRSSTAMTIRVTGHQWFWEVRYPGAGAVTANEIHIPARTPVNVVTKTADVIHSFWVPQLNRKIDLIPGRTNRVLLEADHPGVYRGQCAEFCGLEHALMRMKVFAEPRTQFESWLEKIGGPATAPATAQQRRGRQLFLSNACAGCHTISGTPASGNIGPDLTHVASRTTLAGATIPNTPRQLRRWITDPQRIKPGNKMPALDLSDAEFRSIATYLNHLR